MSRAFGRRCRAAMAASFLLVCVFAHGEEKKDDKKKDPLVVVVVPPAIVSGAKKTILIRGLNLSNVTEIKFPDAKAEIKAEIKSKGKVEVPKPLEPPQAGDTKVDVEVTLPADLPPGPLLFTLTAPEGMTKPYALIVHDPATVQDEKEPNGGYRTAQACVRGKKMLGSIHDANDVDVFRFDGKAKEKIAAQITAQTLNSALDSSLLLVDAHGSTLATSDDTESSRDSLLRFSLPADGTYYLVLQDAHGRGGPTHVYFLTLENDR